VKVLEVEVTGSDGVIRISQPSAFNQNGYDEIILSAEQIDLFVSMIKNAIPDAMALKE
jgi:hypothetical protein